MNSLMNISVRVRSAQAQREIDALRAEIMRLRSELAQARGAAAGLHGGVNNGIPALARWGSQLQWAGRQLAYNFTVPLVAATVGVGRFALASEQEMVRVRKVYGDASMPVERLERDMVTLAEAADYMSVRFAVAREEVLNIAGDWAAAGAAGGALGNAMDATLQTMVLGEMEAADATRALIAIQAQYGASTEELIDIIHTLNVTENETGITFQGLIEGFERSAGVARSAGVDYRHLAAMLAAMVPAAGTATRAGNGLRTIISRVMSPTNDAADAMERLGLNIYSTDWASLNVTERLERMALAFDNLTGEQDGMISSQQTAISTMIASRWQINRFDVLMRDMAASLKDTADANGFYGKSLEATESQHQRAQTSIRELQIVLESSPKAVERGWQVMRNALSEVFMNVLPQIIWLINAIAKMTQAFANMDPALQKAVLGLFAFLAVLGPPIAFVGALAVAVGRLGQAVKWLAGLAGISKFFGLFSKGAGSAAVAIGAGGAAAAGGKSLVGAIGGFLTRMNTAKNNRLDKMFAGVSTAAHAAARGVQSAWLLMFSGQGLRAVMQGALATIGAFVGRLSALPGVVRSIGTAVQVAFAMMFSGNILKVGVLSFTSTMTAFAATTILRLRTAGLAFGGFRAAALLNLGAVGATIRTVGPRMFTGLTSALYSANVAFQLFFFTTLPALVRRGFLGLGRIVAAGHIALNVIFSRGLVANMMAFAAWSTGLGAAMSRGMAAMAAAVTTGMVAVRAAFARGMAGLAALGGALRIVGGALGFLFTRSFWAGALGGVARGAKSLGTSLAAGIRAAGPMLARAATGLVRFITGPIGLAVTTVLSLIAIFKDQLVQVFRNIQQAFRETPVGFQNAWEAVVALFNKGVEAVQRAFNRLPEGVQNALRAVANLVQQAAQAVYEAFQWMNPFARHSPSLVENVTKGMRIVGNQFQAAAMRAGSYMQQMYGAMRRFGRATAGMVQAVERLQFRQDQQVVIEFGGAGAGRAYDEMYHSIRRLRKESDLLKQSVDAQQRAVDAAERKLDNYRKTAQAIEETLSSLRDRASAFEEAISNVNTAIDKLANTPLRGMGAMEDAIFNNTIAQNKLQLEILKLKRAMSDVEDNLDKGGDNWESRLASIRGEIEGVMGMRNDLRAAGADRSILAAYDNQISALENEYSRLYDLGPDKTTGAGEQSSQSKQIEELEKALESLRREGEIMDLERALKFDPLTRQIEKLINTSKELTFDQIVTGIREQQRRLPPLEGQLRNVNSQIRVQEASLERANAQAEAAQVAYDLQRDSLKGLENAYSAVNDQLTEMESMLDGAVAAANALRQAAEEAARAAEAASKMPKAESMRAAKVAKEKLPKAGKLPKAPKAPKLPKEKLPKVPKVDDPSLFDYPGEFEDPGGIAKFEDIDFEEWLDEYIKETSNIFDDIDLFAPFREKWEQFKGWWNTNVYPIWEGLVSGLGEIFGDINWLGFLKGGGLVESIRTWWDTHVSPVWNRLDLDWGAFFGKIFGDAKHQIGIFWGNLKVIWNDNAPDLSEAFEELKTALGDAWKAVEGAVPIIVGILTGLLGTVGGILLTIGNVLFSVATNVLESVFKMVLGIVNGIIRILTGLIQVITGIVNIIVGFLTGDTQKMEDGIFKVGEGIGNVFGGAFDIGKSVVTGVIDTVGGIMTGIVEGVGNAIGQIEALFGIDLAETISTFFKDIYDGVVEWIGKIPGAVAGFFQDLWDKAVEKAKGLWNDLVGNSIFPDIYNDIVDWMEDLPGKIADYFVEMKDKVVEKAKEIWNSLVGEDGWFPRTYNSIVNWFKSLPARIQETFTNMKNRATEKAREIWNSLVGEDGWFPRTYNGIVNWIKGLPGRIQETFTNMKNRAADKAREIWTDIAGPDSWFGRTHNGIVNWIKGLPGRILNTFTDIKNRATNRARELWTSVAGPDSWFGRIYNGVVNWIKNLPGRIQETFTNMKNRAANRAREIWVDIAGPNSWFGRTYNGIIGWIQNLPSRIVSTFSNMKTSAVNRAREIWSEIAGPDSFFAKLYRGVRDWLNDTKNAVSNIWGSIRAAFARPINWVIDNVWNNGIRGVFKAVVDVVPGLKIKIPTIDNIRERAKGGYTSPGWTLVGEEGPELIQHRDPFRVYTTRETQEALRGDPGNAVQSAFSATNPPHGAGNWFSDRWENIKSAASWVSDGVRDATGKLVKWVRGGLADAAGLVLNPLKKLIGQTLKGADGGKFGDLLGGLGDRSIDGVMKWLRGEDEKANVPPDAGKHQLRGARPHVNNAAFALANMVGGIRTMQAFNQSMAGGHPKGLAVDFIDRIAKLNKLADIISSGTHYENFNYMAWNRRLWRPKTGWTPQTYGFGNDPFHTWHLHAEWFDRGGFLKPGMSAVMNESGKPEAVLTADQWANVSRLVSRVMRGEMNVDGSAGPATIVNNIHSEKTTRITIERVEFPNITSPDDAEKFVRNLETLTP